MVRRIAHGSYGEVWLARNVMGTYRAVKVVYRNHFSEDRPYEREFDGIRRFEPISRSHEGFVNLLQVGRNDQVGYFYYAMELADDCSEIRDPRSAIRNWDAYVPRTLRSELNQRCRLPVAECVKIGLALASALEHLHRAGLVHRDIKPSNVIFVDGLCKLADIGLVTAADEQCSFVGTEGYVAPEGPGGGQADIFALGKVLYEIFTGLPVAKYPDLPKEWGGSPDLEAQEFNEVVNRACNANMKWRYKTAEEMRSDLELLRIKKSVLRLRRLERVVTWLRWGLAGAAATLILGGSIFGFLFFKSRAAEQYRRRELREIRISRTIRPRAGWFTNNWSRLERAAAIRMDEEIVGQATALIAGIDARPMKIHDGVQAGSAAFAPDGRVLVGGLGMDAVMLLDTNGVMTQLSGRGEGPVCWTHDAAPLQLTAASNSLVLREFHTGTVRRQFLWPGTEPAGSNPATVLALAPDGGSAAAAMSGRVCVWKATTGQSLGVVATEATALAFNPDGSLLGIGTPNGTTRVYGVPSLAEIAVLPPAVRGSAILCLAFARDRVVPYDQEQPTNSWVLATGDQAGEIVIWDLQRRMPRTFCRGSTWFVSALAFHPDGLTLASAGQSEARLWDVTRGELLLRLSPTSGGQSRFVVFDAEGGRFICGGEPGAGRGLVVLWKLEPHRGIHVLRGLASAARKVWFSPNSQRLAALSDNWHLAVWEIDSGRLVFLFDSPIGVTADNAAGCFDASGDRFAFATGREARLYDLGTGAVLQRWSLADGMADQLQSDDRGRLLLLRRERASKPRRWIWRLLELAESAHPILLHEQTETNWSALDMAFPAGGNRFLVWNGWPAETRQIIRAIDATSGREVWKAATGQPSGDLRICLDPSGRSFGYWTYELSHMRLMRLSDFEEIGTTKDRCQAIGPSGERYFVRDEWLLLDRPDLKDRIPLGTDWRALSFVSAFSPNGKLLAQGTEEGVVLVVDIQATRHQLSTLRR